MLLVIVCNTKGFTRELVKSCYSKLVVLRVGVYSKFWCRILKHSCAAPRLFHKALIESTGVFKGAFPI